MKKLFLILLAITILISLTACRRGSTPTPVPTQSAATAVQTSPTPVPTPVRTPGIRPTESNPTGTNKLGDIFYMGKWDAAIESYDFVTEITDKDGKVFKAPEGTILLVANFRVTNNDSTDKSFVLDMSEFKQKVFKAVYNSGTNVYEVSTTFLNDDLLMKTVYSYTTATGFIAFQVDPEVQTSGNNIYVTATGGSPTKTVTIKLR